MKLKAPETVFSSAGFCPGCGHGLATRLIGEVSEELGIQEKMLAVVDVACCSFNIDYWRYDTIMAAHGRDIPTAVGVKHIRPENPVFAYLGDGAAYSIGMAETIHAALRNDNICVFVVNNSVFGMTGGQMAPTSLPGGELVGPAGMNNCKKLIRKAFEHQLNGDGFSLVELLSPCPTNLNMPPVKAREHVHTEMTKYFPIGEYIDKKGGNQA